MLSQLTESTQAGRVRMGERVSEEKEKEEQVIWWFHLVCLF